MELFVAVHPPCTTCAPTFKSLAVIPQLNPTSDTRTPGARLCFTQQTPTARWWQAWQDRAGAWQGKTELAKGLWLLFTGLATPYKCLWRVRRIFCHSDVPITYLPSHHRERIHRLPITNSLSYVSSMHMLLACSGSFFPVEKQEKW